MQVDKSACLVLLSNPLATHSVEAYLYLGKSGAAGEQRIGTQFSSWLLLLTHAKIGAKAVHIHYKVNILD